MPARRRPIDVHRQAAEVIHREASERIPWKLQRLQGIRLAMEGQDGYRRIAQIVRTTTATLNKWINWYREGGIEGLLSRPVGTEGGKTPRFTPEEWERFRAQLATGTWRTAHGARRAALAQGVLERRCPGALPDRPGLAAGFSKRWRQMLME